ncbi:MAG: queuosine precursor transporter [Paludibacteraceae bacterium]|nr:queuosine precursor transporter [Paludibacteraceae bacterium]
MKKQVSLVFMACGILFSVCLIIANIVEQKLIQIGPIEATAGLIIFPFSYILNDVISEVWGYRQARYIIWMGFFANFLAVAIFQLSIALPSSVHFLHNAEFNLVLGATLRITLASFAAFLIGSFLNAYVMSRMKILQGGRNFSLRAVVSTMVGEGADSMCFFFLAFVGIVPTKDLLLLILTQALMKTIYEIIMLPISNRLVRWVKQKEDTDVFDQDIDYNPFKFK